MDIITDQIASVANTVTIVIRKCDECGTTWDIRTRNQDDVVFALHCPDCGSEKTSSLVDPT